MTQQYFDISQPSINSGLWTPSTPDACLNFADLDFVPAQWTWEEQTDLEQEQWDEPQGAEITANFTFEHFDPPVEAQMDQTPP